MENCAKLFGCKLSSKIYYILMVSSAINKIMVSLALTTYVGTYLSGLIVSSLKELRNYLVCLPCSVSNHSAVGRLSFSLLLPNLRRVL